MSTTATTTADDIRRTDRQFLAACQRAGVPATNRQAAKWRRRRGKAFASRQAEATAERATGVDPCRS